MVTIQTPPATVIPADDLRVPGSRVLRFEGEAYGATTSWFVVDCDPGQGPVLHRHPYDETFHVYEGEATLEVGEETLILGPGDTAIAPARAWHRFTNTGSGALHLIGIHASPVMIQENYEDL